MSTHDWIGPLAAKEKERISLAREFYAAIPRFLSLLADQITTDLTAYWLHFPLSTDTERPEVSVATVGMPKLVFTLNRGLDNETTVSVSFDPYRRNIKWSYNSKSQTVRGGERVLELDNLGIHLQDRDPTYTATLLSEKILRPVLFPMP